MWETRWKRRRGPGSFCTASFFAQSDFRRRRIFLSKTFPCFGGPPPETELDAMKMLFRLEERRREAYRKKNDGKEAKPLYLCGGHLEKWL